MRIPDLADARCDGCPARLSAVETVRAQLALAAGDMASFEWDIPGEVVHCEDKLAEHFGLLRGRGTYGIAEFFAVIHPDDVAAIDAAVSHSIATGDDYAMEWRVRHPHGTVRWLGGRGRIVERDADGTALRMLGVNWDITEAKENEARLKTMALEMEHRVKNAFAVVSALTGLAARRAGSLAEMEQMMRGQIRALGEAHGLALRSTERGQAVRIADLLRVALAPWEGMGVEVNASCGVSVSPQAASGLAMLLYELATNAAKYGGLSGEGARLRVDLAARAGGGAELTWRERLPATALPLHDTIAGDGYGSILLAQAAGMLHAEMRRTLEPDGLTLRLRIPGPATARHAPAAGPVADPQGGLAEGSARRPASR